MTSLLFLKEYISYWEKVTGLSLGISNKESQIIYFIHVYLYVVG